MAGRAWSATKTWRAASVSRVPRQSGQGCVEMPSEQKYSAKTGCQSDGVAAPFEVRQQAGQRLAGRPGVDGDAETIGNQASQQ